MNDGTFRVIAFYFAGNLTGRRHLSLVRPFSQQKPFIHNTAVIFYTVQ